MANDHVMIGDIPDKEFGEVICDSHEDCLPMLKLVSSEDKNMLSAFQLQNWLFA